LATAKADNRRAAVCAARPSDRSVAIGWKLWIRGSGFEN